MRCNNCNKFVPYEDPHEVELENAEADSEELRITVRAVLKCGECSEELKDAEIEFTQDLEIDEKHTEHSLTVEFDPEPATKSEGKGRYAKMFYGFEGTFKIICDECGDTVAEGNSSGYEQASLMNELQ